MQRNNVMAILATCILLSGGCRHGPAAPVPGRETPLETGLMQLGKLELGGEFEPTPVAGTELIVVIKDRHATHGAITRARRVLYQVQRDNSRAMRFLIQKGFHFLGCEAARGPLPTSPAAEAHRKAARGALARGEDLDRLTIYQPLRHAIEHEKELLVLGVEDPDLYHADTTTLEEIVRLDIRLRRADTPKTEVPALRARLQKLLKLIRSHTQLRGRHAAENLLATMRERHMTRGVLLIGGAHVPAVSAWLRQNQVSHLIFESHSYVLPSGGTAGRSRRP